MQMNASVDSSYCVLLTWLFKFSTCYMINFLAFWNGRTSQAQPACFLPDLEPSFLPGNPCFFQ